MKSTLIILLLVLFAGNNVNGELLDSLYCIFKNENIIEQALNIYKSFQTRDISKIISTVFSAYFVIEENVRQCFEEKPALRSLTECVNPKYYELCRSKCQGMLHMICKKDCYNAWCL